MKPNRTRSIAKAQMRRFGQKKNRPEQILAAALIESHLRSSPMGFVETEELVKCFNPDEPNILKEISVDITVKFPPQRAKPDGLRVAIELNGPPHDELPQIRRDRRKQIILEWKGNDWKYLIFDYNKMEILFLRNRRNLTYNETVRAYGEIIITVGEVLPLKDASKIAIEEVLRKTQLS